jgi:tRNA threonylcarbamoyladenosine biosynthesis protein TsaE
MHIRLHGEAAQIAFGRRIAENLRPPGVIYLEGDLGTGKTTLARGVLWGLGYVGPVRSPTYTLLEPYELELMRLYHLDLYRLGDPEELEYLGLRDLLDGQSLLLVEWPERGKGVLPPPDLRIRIAHAGQSRDLELVAAGPRGAELASRLSDPRCEAISLHC